MGPDMQFDDEHKYWSLHFVLVNHLPSRCLTMQSFILHLI